MMICPICGKEFETNGKKMFCSKKCANRSAYENFKEARKTFRKCPVCGKMFEKKIGQKCCSEKCAKIYRGTHEKICSVCGKRFVPNKDNRNICSDACRKNRQKKPKPKKTSGSLSKMAAEARKAGMTYGKYIEFLENTENKNLF